MNMRLWTALLILTAAVGFAACGDQKVTERRVANGSTKGEGSDLAAKISRFAPTEIAADTARLSEGDQRALDRIVAAARLMDPLFLRQSWSGNEALRESLESDTSPAGVERLHYFLINKGPWSRLDEGKPFIDGVPAQRPSGGGFYPEDMTREEFESWVKRLPEAQQAAATGFFHVIRRGADRGLRAVPYAEEYKEFLQPAMQLLREAAALTTNATLKNYLQSRAEAFESNDYYASDVAWMELDAPIELTIGPYETYEDELFNYKAAFEAFVTIRDEAESAKLVRFGQYLQELEDNLPIEPKYRNPKLGASSPIRVVDVVFTSGDGNRGVQTAAFNLPNDERVIREKGSKRVMLKNVQEAKFKQTLVPISRVVLDDAGQGQVAFDAFFTHILTHELMHGLGPHTVRINGAETTVRKQLKELYSAIEEAKADVTGLWALQYLVDKGVVDRQLESQMYTTYLASMFRSVRFGITEAHGKGVALQFNYFVDAGAIEVDEAAGLFRIKPDVMKDAVRRLTAEILTLQAEGSYDKAKGMLDRYAVIRPAMQKAFDRLSDVPVDIEPIFATGKKE